MSKQIWIDADDSLSIGDRGFLVCNENTMKGWQRHYLRDTPPRTNVSLADTPYGWCGTYNDLATYGCGAYEVIRVARNGRLLLQEITDAETLSGFLEEFGYPDLLDEMLEHIHKAVN